MLCIFLIPNLLHFIPHLGCVFVRLKLFIHHEINGSIIPKSFLSPLLRTVGTISAKFFSFKSSFNTTMPEISCFHHLKQLLTIATNLEEAEHELVSKQGAIYLAAVAFFSPFLLPILFCYVLPTCCIHLFLKTRVAI